LPVGLRVPDAAPQALQEIPGHLGAHYPLPARLDTRYVDNLMRIGVEKSYSKGAILFEDGDTSRGVYVVLEGRVKLSVNSARGKALVLGFYGPRTIIGLAAAILDRTHATKAEALMPTKVAFISRNKFLEDMQDAAAARRAAELASEACYFFLTKMAATELSKSAEQKIARNLLRLLAHNSSHDGEPVHLDMSQETIAQMVGLSRETVSRLLSRLRKKGVLDWTRSDFVIRDRHALERLGDLP
jgi:CRP/FNR family transcriptional regulator